MRPDFSIKIYFLQTDFRQTFRPLDFRTTHWSLTSGFLTYGLTTYVSLCLMISLLSNDDQPSTGCHIVLTFASVPLMADLS